jgi:hypothetical protein
MIERAPDGWPTGLRYPSNGSTASHYCRQIVAGDYSAEEMRFIARVIQRCYISISNKRGRTGFQKKSSDWSERRHRCV